MKNQDPTLEQIRLAGPAHFQIEGPPSDFLRAGPLLLKSLLTTNVTLISHFEN